MIFDLHRVGMQTGSTTRWLTGGFLTGLVLVDIDPADVLSALDKLGELRATVSLTMPPAFKCTKKVRITNDANTLVRLFTGIPC